MPQYNININGLKEFEAAIKRNPRTVLDEVGKFFIRAIAVYNRNILRQPWKIGLGGGGAPVATGNLRDTHQRQIQPWLARIFPTAPYATYVHEGTRRMISRPWMNYAFEHGKGEVENLEKDLLKNIVGDLAK